MATKLLNLNARRPIAAAQLAQLGLWLAQRSRCWDWSNLLNSACDWPNACTVAIGPKGSTWLVIGPTLPLLRLVQLAQLGLSLAQHSRCCDWPKRLNSACDWPNALAIAIGPIWSTRLVIGPTRSFLLVIGSNYNSPVSPTTFLLLPEKSSGKSYRKTVKFGT